MSWVDNMKKIELKLVITEDNGMWHIKTFNPNDSSTFLSVSCTSRNEMLQRFADSLKADNIRYWHMMKEIK